jgi:Zn-dependent peptidase ImmA (M78 family)
MATVAESISPLTEMPDYTRAEREAQTVLDDLHITTAPVNPTEIANRLGYTVHAAQFRDPKLSGRIVFKNGNARIDVNAWDAPNRRRFTIAHEIGHALLHAPGFDNFEVSDRVDEGQIEQRELTLARQTHDGFRPVHEAEADRFAAALLMPPQLVKERFQRDPNPAYLAETFSVSEAAMKIRLKQLGLAH